MSKEIEVGPIWGNHEAKNKIEKWLRDHPDIDQEGWKWTGHWRSRNGTSYADFIKSTQNVPTMVCSQYR